MNNTKFVNEDYQTRSDMMLNGTIRGVFNRFNQKQAKKKKPHHSKESSEKIEGIGSKLDRVGPL